jgi:YtxH-like protein
MQYSLRTISSLGAVLATSPLVRSLVSNYFSFDPLGAIGLERRHSRVLERVALVGIGAAVGAGTALLLAPMTGQETRRKLAEQAEKVSTEAKKAGEKALGYLEDASAATASAVSMKHTPIARSHANQS